VIIEPTSSVFILRHDRERGWAIALVWHPRLECWLPAGGHVEADETAAQCGIREALEETGLEVTLVPCPAGPVPAGFPHRLVPAPWLVAEVPAAFSELKRSSRLLSLLRFRRVCLRVGAPAAVSGALRSGERGRRAAPQRGRRAAGTAAVGKGR
jgi:8-oxo-dGTP pyrophosphatase MutT (NUDIX family)